MKYSDVFSSQWDALIQALGGYLKDQQAGTITVRRLNDWYETASFRWLSFTEREGILLRSQEKEELVRELTAKISGFRFTSLEAKKSPRVTSSLLWGLAAGALVTVVLALLSFSRLLGILLGLLAWGVTTLLIHAMVLDRFAADEKNRLTGGYMAQLEALKPVLMEICKKYE